MTATITPQDWLDLMPIVRGQGWRVRVNDKLIRNMDGHCPICAVANEVIGVSKWTLDARIASRIVFDDFSFSCLDIILAADHIDHPYRKELEASLGITP